MAERPGAFAKQDRARQRDGNRSAQGGGKGRVGTSWSFCREEPWGGQRTGFLSRLTYCENTKGEGKPPLTHDPCAGPQLAWGWREGLVQSQPQPSQGLCSAGQVTGLLPTLRSTVLPTNLSKAQRQRSLCPVFSRGNAQGRGANCSGSGGEARR